MELRPKFATSKDIKTSDTNLFKTNKSDVKKNNNNEQIEKTKNNLVKQNKTHASDKLSEQVSNIIKGIGIILPKNFNDTTITERRISVSKLNKLNQLHMMMVIIQIIYMRYINI